MMHHDAPHRLVNLQTLDRFRQIYDLRNGPAPYEYSISNKCRNQYIPCNDSKSRKYAASLLATCAKVRL